LLLINATLAYKAAEGGDHNLAKRHVRIIEETKCGAGGQVLRESLKPIRNRLKTLCETAEKKAEEDEEHSDVVAKDLLANAKLMLEIVDVLLPEGDPFKQSTHDDVAQVVVNSAIGFGNKTDNCEDTIILLGAALDIAIGQGIRGRISRNLEIFHSNKKFVDRNRCFFCDRTQGDQESSIERTMHGEVHKVDTGNRTYTLRWKHAKVTVPRCKQCKRNQRRIMIWDWLGALTGISIAAGVGIVCGNNGIFDRNDTTPFVAAAGMMLSVAAGSVIAHIWVKRRIGYAIKPLRKQDKHPNVQSRLGQGWTFGEDPTDAEKAAAPYERSPTTVPAAPVRRRNRSENFELWKASGEPETWVRAHFRGWNDDDCRDLLASLRQSQYWPMFEVDIRKHLESIRGKLR
jgi:hypothetical protein